MKRQVQRTGTRDWWGDQLTDMQDEIFLALENAVLNDIGQCILKDFTVNHSAGSTEIASTGYVYLFDSSGVNGKICKVETSTTAADTIYLVQDTKDGDDNSDYEDTYGDGSVKDIINEYYAKVETSLPAHSNYIKITDGEPDTEVFTKKIIESYTALITSADKTGVDLNSITAPGKYFVDSGAANNPTTTRGQLFVMRLDEDNIVQLFVDLNSYVCTRSIFSTGNNGWSINAKKDDKDSTDTVGDNTITNSDKVIQTLNMSKNAARGLIMCNINVSLSLGGSASTPVALRLYFNGVLIKTKIQEIYSGDSNCIGFQALVDEITSGDTIELKAFTNSLTNTTVSNCDIIVI